MQKGINENWAAALEYNPEGIARVMLYVDMELYGVPLKAFVDSGTQSTIISKSCAERCGLLRLLDERYKGIFAHGVGQSEILGRIHVAPIKIGNIFYPCSIFGSGHSDWTGKPDCEAKVAKLVELSFAREAVMQALGLFDCNEEQAAGFLFGGRRKRKLAYLHSSTDCS
ncbi:hypothetical protein SLE2022_399580 [Rubroshorea leprosula]